MKKLLLMITMMLLVSCSKPPKKPFIIFAKGINYSEQGCIYYYYDANGNKEAFFEPNEKYNIGDTIK